MSDTERRLHKEVAFPYVGPNKLLLISATRWRIYRDRYFFVAFKAKDERDSWVFQVGFFLKPKWWDGAKQTKGFYSCSVVPIPFHTACSIHHSFGPEMGFLLLWMLSSSGASLQPCTPIWSTACIFVLYLHIVKGLIRFLLWKRKRKRTKWFFYC
jgi:hypothetical protein